MLTKAEKYVIDKGWDYRTSGNQIAIEYCPFCRKDGYKFFLNVDSFLWDCKRPDCPSNKSGKGGGNEWKLKKHMGDKMDEVSEATSSRKQKGKQEVEGIPDYEQAHQWLLGEPDWMNYLNDMRGWDFDLVKRMKIGMMNRWITDEQSEIGCFTYPYVINGKCEFVKFRTMPGHKKNFSSLSGRDVPLYNQDAVQKGMEYLVLVEGEADTLSVLALGEENVVGVPGAGMKQATWSDLLDYPGKLYLLFDSDEDGQEGAKKFAERFGINRFYNIVLPEFDLDEPVEDKPGKVRTKGKDITEWRMTGKTNADFKELLSSAQLFSVDGVSSIRKSLSELRKEIAKRGNNLPQYDTPWESLNKTFGGADDGQLVIIQAAQKTGKTSLALDWADYLVKDKKVNVLFECLEMPDTDLARKWASYVTNTDDSPGALSFEQVLGMLDEADGKAKTREAELHFGYVPVESLEQEFERLRSIIQRYGIKVLFFDNLQYLVDKVWAGERASGGRPAFISKVTKMFKSLAMEMKMLVVLIAQTKGLDEDTVATAGTLEGSRAPGNDCDTMMIMNRTKQMQIKSKDELQEMAGLGDNTLNTQTLNPELFIEVGLTRRAPGGLCVLMIDGARSLVFERPKDAITAAMINANTERVGGMKVTRSKKKKEAASHLPAAMVNPGADAVNDVPPVAVI
jgi:KaiC/GvpD/RAD55 family RecA-like ATPase